MPPTVISDDPKTAQWLDSDRWDFDWHAENFAKNIPTHKVTADDIVAMFSGFYLLAGRIVRPGLTEQRWMVLGTDSNGRRLTLVFTIRGGNLRPISCRPMRTNEGERFEEARRAYDAK